MACLLGKNKVKSGPKLSDNSWYLTKWPSLLQIDAGPLEERPLSLGERLETSQREVAERGESLSDTLGSFRERYSISHIDVWPTTYKPGPF